jgi:hypothetical protein
VCRQLIELWEILFGRVEAGQVTPSQRINSSKLTTSQLHHISQSIGIDLTTLLRFALLLLGHENWWQGRRLLVITSVAIVLFNVGMELRHFSILFEFEFVRAHYCLFCVSEFVYLVFLLLNYSLLILVAAIRLVV